MHLSEKILSEKMFKKTNNHLTKVDKAKQCPNIELIRLIEVNFGIKDLSVKSRSDKSFP